MAGETWNVSSLVGLIGLFGIAVQNRLVLISQTRRLISEGKPFEQALREASIGRMRPKIMTAATAILGLLPLLVLRLHGTEIERPLAIVMVGGLVTSTLFTLLALLTFYLFVHHLQQRWRTVVQQEIECIAGVGQLFNEYFRLATPIESTHNLYRFCTADSAFRPF